MSLLICTQIIFSGGFAFIKVFSRIFLFLASMPGGIELIWRGPRA